MSKETSIEVTIKARLAWRKHCKKLGRTMKSFTSETLTKVIKGELIEIPEKRAKFK